MQKLWILHHNSDLSRSRKPHIVQLRSAAAGVFLLTILASIVLLGCNSSPVPAKRPLTPQEERGQRLYEAHCAVCHDAYSTKPRQGPGLAGMFQKKYLPSGAPANDERARDSFMMGRGNMPAFQSVLDDQQANDLMAYLHTL